MKRALKVIIPVACCVLLGGFAMHAHSVAAQDADSPVVTIYDPYYRLQADTVTLGVQLHTNENTTALLEYGTAAGQYADSVELTGESSDHSFIVEGLAYEQTYYFRGTVTDTFGHTAESGEVSVSIPKRGMHIENIELLDAGHESALIRIEMSKRGYVQVQYGSDSGTLPNVVTSNGGIGGDTEHIVTIRNLHSNTAYYYTVTAAIKEWDSIMYPIEEDQSDFSDERTFTTTGEPAISSISPQGGPEGTVLVLSGTNLGSGTSPVDRAVTVGCDAVVRRDCPVMDIISWTDSEIKVRTTNGAQAGPVFVYQGLHFNDPIRPFIDLIAYEGPTFMPTDEQAAVGSVLTEAYGCVVSTGARGNNTIEVPNLFAVGSETDAYLGQVYDAYFGAWGRHPRCTELQFHLDHATPIDRLLRWLQEETITEKYGCVFSSTEAGEASIRIGSGVTLGSETDAYLGQVYDAYFGAWGRHPRCTELQFHLDHATPIDRLTSWLQHNAQIVQSEDPRTTDDVIGTRIAFRQDNENVAVEHGQSSLIFSEHEKITLTGTATPNSIIILTIASNSPIMATTRSGANGLWIYALDGPLEPGAHTVQLAVTDASGTIIAASDIVDFTVLKSIEAGDSGAQGGIVGFSVAAWAALIIGAVLCAALIAAQSRKNAVRK
ncbi:MAG: Ig-like domain-containing protein [Patescibacteria group bacterium]